VQRVCRGKEVFLKTSEGERIAFSPCPRTPHLWRRLDRLARDWKNRSPRLNCRRLILLCDTPLPKLPPGTQTRLQALNQLPGVRSVCPLAKQLIGLDALHTLLTEAHRGELVYEGKSLPAEDVDRWARESIAAAGHELGVMRLLFDDLGLDLPSGRDSGASVGKPALARNA
jgi:hypothetical protein